MLHHVIALVGVDIAHAVMECGQGAPLLAAHLREDLQRQAEHWNWTAGALEVQDCSGNTATNGHEKRAGNFWLGARMSACRERHTAMNTQAAGAWKVQDYAQQSGSEQQSPLRATYPAEDLSEVEAETGHASR